MNKSNNCGGWKRLGNSFGCAARGIAELLISQPNARIHLVLMGSAIIAGFGFQISAGEWIALALASGLVLAAESMNTAIEILSDEALGTTYHPAVRRLKDIAAGGVLLAALAALATGLIIFLPYIAKGLYL